MTSPNVNVQITGDASGAVGAAKAAQAAIDSLHGKSVDVDINFRGGGASGFASEAGRAADAAGDAFRGFSDRVNRASGDMGGFRDAARAAGSDLDRISRSRPIFNDSDVSNARTIRGEIERISDSGGGGGLSRLEGSALAWGAISSGIGRSGREIRALEAGTAGAGREMRALESGASRAVIEMRDVGGVFQAVDNNGSRATRVIDAVGRAMSDTGGSSRKLTDMLDYVPGTLSDIAGMAGTAARGIGLLGIAGVYSAAGGAIAAAAVGGAGFAAAVADIASSAPTLSKAKNLVTDFGQEFRKVAPQTTALAMPGLENMSDQVKAIGAFGAQLGLQHMPEMFRAANTALAQVIPTAKALEPAISPAVAAAESLVMQMPRIAAAATPVLNTFSDTVRNGAEGLADLGIVGVKAAGALGSATVSVASTWGDRLEAMDRAAPNMIPTLGDFTAGLFGGKSNQLDPNSGQVSFANQWGGVTSATTLGTIIGGLIGGPPGMLIGGGLAAAGSAIYEAVDSKLPQEDAATARGRQVGATYADTGAVAPWYDQSMDADRADYPGQRPNSAMVSNKLPVTGTVSGPGAPAMPPTAAEQAAQLQKNTTAAEQTKQQVLQAQHAFGEGNLSGGASQLAQINQEMAKTANMSPLVSQGMSNVGSAAQQSMQQAGNAAQQGAPQFQQGLNQMQQHAQQLPPQIGSTMSMLAPALAEPMQQLPQQAAQAIQPQPIADAASSAVTKAVKQVQPEAQSGGEDLGASVPEGAGQGITKNVDKVVTIIEHLIKKVIQVGAEGLDSHSPSRVFAELGASIPQGLAVGMESDSSLAVAASKNLIGQVTQGAASQLGGQNQLQNQLAQQQQASQQAQQAAQQAQQAQAQAHAQQQALQNQGFGFLGPQGQQQTAAAMLKQQQELERAMQTGDTSRLSPELRQQVEQQKQALGGYQYKDGFWGDQARHNTLTDKLGYSEATAERVEQREQAHDKRAAEKKDERRQAHVDALMRGGTETSVRTKLEHEFREQGKAVGNGTADGMKAAQGKVSNGVSDMINGLIDQSKKRLGISSPSKVFAGIGGDTAGGLAGGMSGALTSASTAAMGVASDRGLQVGYRWATSMVTGIQSVFKSSDFQANAVPQVQNDQAKAVLGQLGYLGAAGGGASIYKTPMVALGGATTSDSLSNRPSYNLTINLDGEPFRQLVVNSSEAVVNAIADMIPAQVG